MDTTEILKSLISIDSRFDRSNKKIVDHINNLLNKFECQVFKVDDAEVDIYNLIVKIPGIKNDNPLVFVGHTDTVLIGEGWETSPFDPVEKEKKIYGLGSSDMKAGLASMISAILKIKDKPNQDIYLIFDCDEEFGGKGGLDVVKKFSLENARVIIPEPTGEKIILGQKGCIDLEIQTSGKAIHASLASPEKNQILNANYKAIRICNALIEHEKKIFGRPEGEYGSPTLSISYVCGGTGAANVLSDKCIIRLGRRLTPSENLNEVYEEMEKIILKADPEAKIKKLFWGDSYGTKKEGIFVQNIKKLADEFFPNNEFGIKYGWTEASLFSKWGETVIFGPGEDSMCHKKNEYCKIENLEKFTELCKRLIENA